MIAAIVIVIMSSGISFNPIIPRIKRAAMKLGPLALSDGHIDTDDQSPARLATDAHADNLRSTIGAGHREDAEVSTSRDWSPLPTGDALLGTSRLVADQTRQGGRAIRTNR